MQQDFTKRIAIVVNRELEEWQVLNVVSHISAYLGNKMTDKFDTGDYFETKDGKLHPRNSQFPIIVLAAKEPQLNQLINEVRNSKLLYIGFIREMIETTDDQKLADTLSNKLDTEVEYLGIGVFGPNEKVKDLTKKFSLWK